MEKYGKTLESQNDEKMKDFVVKHGINGYDLLRKNVYEQVNDGASMDHAIKIFDQELEKFN